MNHPPIQKRQRGELFQFSDYQKMKPFFKSPLKITVDSPNGETYHMLENIVYQDKQILALRKEQDAHTIYFVEAIIEAGQLTEMRRIPTEVINDVTLLLAKESF